MIVGPLLLGLALLAVLGGAAAALLAIRGHRAGLAWMRGLTYLALASVACAALLLLALLLAQRYDFAYVYQYTSRALPWGYRLSAFWAGQQGSLLLWVLLGAIFTVLQLRRARQLAPYVVFFLLLVQAGLTMLLLADSPFRALGGIVDDGLGLNPLLQNPWMMTHPPVLFVGYAGLAVPFAYALAALWRRDYDGWVPSALPWTLLGWLFLGAGIYLGAYWAYETLGWGGYWGWDLVENSSLVPWLTGTALLHLLLLHRYRQRLRPASLILALATFLLVLYATFLTRSGILSELSPHSFVESPLMPWLAGLILVWTAVGGGLLLARWRDIPRSPVFAGRDESPPRAGDVVGTVGRTARSWLSRDLALLLAVLILLMVTTPIWLGTLTPVVIKAAWGTPAILDVSFYPQATGPWVLLLLAVLGLCPFLGWQESDWRRLRRGLLVPAIVALLAALLAVLLGVRAPYPLLFILLATLALASNAALIVRTARGGLLRLGGYLTHVGVGLLVVGIIASSVYAVAGPSLALVEGQPQETLGHQVTFVGWQEAPGEKPALRLEVARGDARFIALPRLYVDPQRNTVMATPHIHRFLTHDVYIAAEAYEPAPGPAVVQLAEEQTAQAAGYGLTLEALILREEVVEAVLTVVGEGQTRLVTATLPVDEEAPYVPISLPGGGVLTVLQVDLEPAGRFWVEEAAPVAIGPYWAQLLHFTMLPHGAAVTSEAGAVLEFTGPQGVVVITPTWSVAGEGAVSPPVELAPGVSVRLVGMAVEQRAVQLQVDGIAWRPQALLQVQGAGDSAGRVWVHLSVKPGMNLLWAGGLLLLLGTLVAVLRRGREAGRIR